MINLDTVTNIDKIIAYDVFGGINPDSVQSCAYALANYTLLNRKNDERVAALSIQAEMCNRMPNDSNKYDMLCDLLAVATNIATDHRNARNAKIVDALGTTLIFDVSDMLRRVLSNERISKGPYVADYELVWNEWRAFKNVVIDQLSSNP